jgi:hypothetical protein
MKIENALAEPNSTGIYICLTKGCARRIKEVEFPYCTDWPLAKRQHKCRSCRKNLTLYKVKKVMSEEAKAKLKELGAKRKRRKED